MGPGTFGAIQNEATLKRVDAVKDIATVLLAPETIANPEFPNARTSSHVVLEVDAKDFGIYENELFGPIVLVIKTKNTEHSVELAKEMAAKHGAITCAAYTTDAETEKLIAEEMESVFAPVSFNLTGGIL